MAYTQLALDPPPGFRGLDPELPIQIHRRNLPHWRQEGATYFVTFRLADSLPARCLEQIAPLRDGWNLQHPEPRSDDDWREYARLISAKEEEWLNRGHGRCFFSQAEYSGFMVETLEKFDELRYLLGSYVVMPNHIHIVVRPFDGFELDGITQGWKGVCARRINRETGRSGTLWQEESYDTIVRDSEHLLRVVRYIGSNPVKANLKHGPIYVRDDWDIAGYTLRENLE